MCSIEKFNSGLRESNSLVSEGMTMAIAKILYICLFPTFHKNMENGKQREIE